MSYNYKEEHRAELFTEQGLEIMLKVQLQVGYLLKEAGAFTAEHAYKDCTGSNWTMLAALDYLVEKGKLRRLSPPGTWAQYQVFADPAYLPPEGGQPLVVWG